MSPEDLAIAFAMHCDEQRLTTSEADALVEAITEALETAAENRRDALASYAPELIDDGERTQE